MKRSLFLLVLPVALVVAACGSSNVTQPDLSGVDNSSGSAAIAAADPGLLGTWTLASLQVASLPSLTIPPAGTFTATFGSDGTLSLRADCNVCSTRYQASSARITVNAAMACTRAACPSAPFDREFAQLTGASINYRVAGDTLVLDSGKGTLRFRR
jgi:heat shock protein HslJ